MVLRLACCGAETGLGAANCAAVEVVVDIGGGRGLANEAGFAVLAGAAD